MKVNIIALLIIYSVIGCKNTDFKQKKEEDVKPQIIRDTILMPSNIHHQRPEILDMNGHYILGEERRSSWYMYWNGDLIIVNTLKNDTIRPPNPDEQLPIILRAKFVFLKGFEQPFVEYYSRTHRGNGNFELVKFDKQKWEVVASIRAIGEDYIENYTLSPEYIDINKDGYSDIQLTGIAKFSEEKEAIKIRQQLIWNKNKNIFIENKKARMGKAWFERIGE